MKYQAIIFDKDGTVLDFNSFWISVSKGVVNSLIKKFNVNTLNEVFLNAIGVFGDSTDPNGVLCKGTYEEIAEIFYNILIKNGAQTTFEEVNEFTLLSFNDNADKGEIKGTCENIDKVFCKLKSLNVKIALITTDNYYITEKCLKGLKIFEYFDYIYTDDGLVTPKPSPDAGINLMEKTGIFKDKILMVGDTLTDATFAKNVGFDYIGVAKTKENKDLLTPFAKTVLDDVSYLYDVLVNGEEKC
jgi:phosphoglycolate phosphatase-like HAD superfamily hydrolase